MVLAGTEQGGAECKAYVPCCARAGDAWRDGMIVLVVGG